MARTRSFGVSTHLFHGQRLNREHLREVSAAAFDHIELFATPTHVDYRSASGVADLRGWLADTRLALHAVHAPVSGAFTAGRHMDLLNLASGDRDRREQALAEALAALQIARQLPFAVLVVHAGIPRTRPEVPGENSRDGARRSLEALADAARPLGVRVAVEVLSNELSRPGSLVHLVEVALEDTDVGICLDVGHAHLGGDLGDAIETVSEHLLTVHVHDNRGRSDDHLLPFDGTIDWAAALTTLQKVGYEGPITFEVTARGTTKDTLAKARTARERMERLLAQR